MAEPNVKPAGYNAIDEDAVALLAKIEGLHFPDERLPAIAQRLRDMHAMAADLDAVDLTGTALSARFDPTWADGGDA